MSLDGLLRLDSTLSLESLLERIVDFLRDLLGPAFNGIAAAFLRRDCLCLRFEARAEGEKSAWGWRTARRS